MIERVIAKNFLSWKDMDVSFPGGVTLIDGWNEDDQTSEGSGKSAVLNAICWGLFGKIPKDANIDDVIKNGEKSCGVEVVFDNAKIRRTRNPNELALIIGDRAVKGKDAKETQTLIEEFIGLSFETFCQTIYFAQNYAKKFVTANQEEKGKILSEVQNLSIFDKAGKEVRNLIKLDEDSLAKLKHSYEVALKDVELVKRDTAAEDLKYQHAVQRQEERVENLNKLITMEGAKYQTAVEQQLKRVAALNTQIEDAEKLRLEYETLKLNLLDKVSNLVYDEPRELLLQEANNQLMSQAGVINAEISGIDALAAKRAAAENQGKRYAARYKQIQAEREKILAFIVNPTKNCPTCGSTLEAYDTSRAVTEIEKIDQELEEITTILTQLSAEMDAPIPTKDELTTKLALVRGTRLANDAEIKQIRAVKEELNNAAVHLSSFEKNIVIQRDRIVKLQSNKHAESAPLFFDNTQLEALKMQLEVEKQPLVFDFSTLKVLQVKLENLQSNIIDLEQLAEAKTKHVSRLETLKNGFREIKSYVFNSLLNELNARVQKYLVHLFEVPVTVRFINEDMKIETNVKFDGVDRGLGLLSGGQFRRVSLAIDLALSDVICARKGSKVGITIWDEYMKDLSEQSMEKVLQLLESRNQPTILIEHNSIFKNIVNNTVFVKLEDGTSRAEIHNN